MDRYRLIGATLPWRLVATFFMLTAGTGYLFAITNVALSVGTSYNEVVRHYYGNLATRAALEPTDPTEPTGVVEEEMLDLDAFLAEEPTADEEILAIPSLKSLVAEAHFHLFGHAALFLGTGLLVLMTGISDRLKSAIVIAPFAGSVLDVWGLFLTRLFHPGFAWLTILSGAAMAISFAAAFFAVMREVWFTSAEKIG